MSEDTPLYAVPRRRRPTWRQALIILGTWSTLILGIASIALYVVVPDMVLIAIGMSGLALSLAIRCYGLITADGAAQGGPIKPATSAK